MKVGDVEKERALFAILKRARTEYLEPRFIRTVHSKIVFKRITDIYGKDILTKLYKELTDDNILEYKNGFYILTAGGKRIIKRGYVHIKVSKYASPEYSFYISVLALIVSVLSSEYFWKAIRLIRQGIEALYQSWLSK